MSPEDYPQGALYRVAAIQHAIAALPLVSAEAAVGRVSGDQQDPIGLAAAQERRLLVEWREAYCASLSLAGDQAAGKRNAVVTTHKTLCEVGSGLWNFIAGRRGAMPTASLAEARALAAELLLTGQHYFSPVASERLGLVSNYRVGIDTAMMCCRVGKEYLARQSATAHDCAAAGELWLRRAHDLLASIEPRLSSSPATGPSTGLLGERFSRAKSELLLVRVQLLVSQGKWSAVLPLLRDALIVSSASSVAAQQQQQQSAVQHLSSLTASSSLSSFNSSSSSLHMFSLDSFTLKELLKIVLSGAAATGHSLFSSNKDAPQADDASSAAGRSSSAVAAVLELCIDYLHRLSDLPSLGESAPAVAPLSPRSRKTFAVALHEQAAVALVAAGEAALGFAHAKHAVAWHASPSTLMLLLKSSLAVLSDSSPQAAISPEISPDAAAIDALFRLVQHPGSTPGVALTGIDLAWAPGSIGDVRPGEVLHAYELLLGHPRTIGHEPLVRWRYAEALASVRRPQDLAALAGVGRDAAAALTGQSQTGSADGAPYGRWFFVALAGLAEELLDAAIPAPPPASRVLGTPAPIATDSSSSSPPSAPDTASLRLGLEFADLAAGSFFMFGDALELAHVFGTTARLELRLYALSGARDASALQRAAAAAHEATLNDPLSPHAALVHFEALLLLGRTDAARAQLAAMRRCEPHVTAMDAFHVAAARALELGCCDLCHQALDEVLSHRTSAGGSSTEDPKSVPRGASADIPVATMARVYVSCILHSETSLTDSACPADGFAACCQVFVPKMVAAASLATLDESPTLQQRIESSWWWASNLDAVGRGIVHRASLDPAMAQKLAPLARQLYECIVRCLEASFGGSRCALESSGAGLTAASPAVVGKLLAAEIVFLGFAWAGNEDIQAVGRHVAAAKSLSRQLLAIRDASIWAQHTGSSFSKEQLSSAGASPDVRHQLAALRQDDEVDVLISIAEIEVAVYTYRRAAAPSSATTATGLLTSDTVASSHVSSGAAMLHEICSLMHLFSKRHRVTIAHAQRVFSCVKQCAREAEQQNGAHGWAELLYAACSCLVDVMVSRRFTPPTAGEEVAPVEEGGDTTLLAAPQPSVLVSLPSSEEWEALLAACRNLVDACLRRADRLNGFCNLKRILLTPSVASSFPSSHEGCIALLRYLCVEAWNDLCYFHNLGEFGVQCEALREVTMAFLALLPSSDEAGMAIHSQLVVLTSA